MSEVDRTHLFVIFGATGDLVHRKLLPALYRVTAGPEAAGARNAILGVARHTLDDKGFRERAVVYLVQEGVSEEEARRWCGERLFYQSVHGEDLEAYQNLASRMESLEKEFSLSGNRVLYLALPPAAFDKSVKWLGKTGLNKSPGWTRVVIEKPFGHDLESAQALDDLLHGHFDESQIYRIDHYLGKETVQNLLFFRFGNAIFESLWNRDWVDHVQITVAESLGVGTRAAYYEGIGAMRDMMQNHLTQILSLIAMEIPTSFDAEAIRHEKVKVLQSILPINPGDVILGQYKAGTVEGGQVPGYLEEEGVKAGSTTETYAAIQYNIENVRWHGVPFYVRTGKRLARRYTQVVVVFRCAPITPFRVFDTCNVHCNRLTMTLQPDEGFDLYFDVKTPGQPISLKTQRLSFRYAEAFGPLPDAYGTLLLDVLDGDQTLFVRSDEVLGAWKLYTPLLEAGIPVHGYEAGSYGPAEANTLLNKDGRQWCNL